MWNCAIRSKILIVIHILSCWDNSKYQRCMTRFTFIWAQKCFHVSYIINHKKVANIEFDFFIIWDGFHVNIIQDIYQIKSEPKGYHAFLNTYQIFTFLSYKKKIQYWRLTESQNFLKRKNDEKIYFWSEIFNIDPSSRNVLLSSFLNFSMSALHL